MTDGLMYEIDGKVCEDDLALAAERLRADCQRLTEENAQLRWYLNDIQRMLDKIPDNRLARSVRFKQWARQTMVELFTRTAPRIMLIWGGAGFVAYIVTVLLR